MNTSRRLGLFPGGQNNSAPDLGSRCWRPGRILASWRVYSEYGRGYSCSRLNPFALAFLLLAASGWCACAGYAATGASAQLARAADRAAEPDGQRRARSGRPAAAARAAAGAEFVICCGPIGPFSKRILAVRPSFEMRSWRCRRRRLRWIARGRRVRDWAYADVGRAGCFHRRPASPVRDVDPACAGAVAQGGSGGDVRLQPCLFWRVLERLGPVQTSRHPAAGVS